VARATALPRSSHLTRRAAARIVRDGLDNATRIAPTHSVVSVHAGRPGDPASLEVTDRGPGIGPMERDMIFKRFQRGSRRGDEGGFGLA